jgi:hypothetical protein
MYSLAGFCEAARHVKPEVSLPDLRHPLSACIEMLLSLLFALVSEARRPASAHLGGAKERAAPTNSRLSPAAITCVALAAPDSVIASPRGPPR